MEDSQRPKEENAVDEGDTQGMTTSRGNRIRWVYSRKRNAANSFQNSVLPPFPSTEDNSSSKHGLAAEKSTSQSTESDSSDSNSNDPDSDQGSRPSGSVKKLKLKGELKTHNDQQIFNVEYKNRDGIRRKTEEYLDFEAEELHQSAFAGNGLEITSSYLDIDEQDVMGIRLVDVQLTVKASHSAENVPFACLKSQSHGIPILGYPVEVGEIADGSETLLLPKESVARKLFSDGGNRLPHLVWRTSKRTPVCYVTNSLSPSISKNVQAGQASENVEESIPSARENGEFIKQKSLVKLLKNPKQFNRGEIASDQTCVPVEIIFSKILTAVCQVQS